MPSRRGDTPHAHAWAATHPELVAAFRRTFCRHLWHGSKGGSCSTQADRALIARWVRRAVMGVEIRVFHVRRDTEGFEHRREVFAPWADELPAARVAWAVHLVFEYGGAVEVVRL